MGFGGSLGEELGWGAMEWGAGGDALQLARAEAIAENIVRLFFTTQVKFTRILDPGDGSNPEYFTIEPVAGTSGLDGLPARAVLVLSVDPTFTNNTGTLDVGLDRPMSPYPAQYVARVSGLVTADTAELLDSTSSSALFFGLQAGIQPNSAPLAVPRRDIANPNDLASLLDPIPNISPTIPLGVFAYDESGDYANDEGTTSYRKRVRRRVITRKNSFAHLPGYGVGLLDQVKQLGRRQVQATLAADAEEQIRQEPETVAVSVSFEEVQQGSGLFAMRVRARSNTGEAVDDLLPIG